MTSYKKNASLGSAGKEPKPQELNMLMALYSQGRYTEMEALARGMTERFPHHGIAWKAMAAALMQQGRHAEALEPMQKAAALLQMDSQTHNNLGNILVKLGRLSEAEASYRRALEVKPDFAEAHSNLGETLRNLGRLPEAEASQRQALKIKPNFAEAYNNLGITLYEQGRFPEAEACLRKALHSRPNYAEAHSNLGDTLQNQGRLPEAEACHRQALGFNPNYIKAHNNLGFVLQELGRSDDAVASYRRALVIKPDFAEALSNLGNAQQDLGQLDDAVASLRQALAIKPDFAEAHSNLGLALSGLGRFDEAMASYRRALALKPDYAKAHSNLLLAYNYLPDQTPDGMLAEARRYGELVARLAHPYTDWRNTPEPGRCLRVGLVSGDFRNHPVGYLLENVLAALSAHAAGRLEFFAYYNHFCTDAVTERIKACCHGWNSVTGLSDENLARQIRDDSIDILIDLSGHTAANRLPVFAWKPAPVQIASWLGYTATIGVAAIDYIFADPWAVPQGEEIHFTEKIWRLPEIYQCYTPPDVDVQVAPLPAPSNGYITFGCFNNLIKINDAVVALWARVLLAVPGSRLLLKTKQLGDASVRQSVVNRFAAHGIGKERLILEGAVPRVDLLATYNRIDIALDPFPYPGGTTSFEALWMGVPLLTLKGKQFLSHIGESILQNAGLPEWIASDADDYVARAASHAGDLQRLIILRDGLRQQVLASPIFDAPRLARHLEAALRGMWVQWCEQQTGKSS